MAETATVETDGPVFPGELFRMIGEHLDSDIKSLKNLAFTSRDVYSFVLPILYRRFEAGKLDKPWIKHLLRQRTAVDLPCGLRFVKSLELNVDLDFQDARVQRLLHECVELESLSFGLTERDSVWPAMQRLSKLPLVEISLTLGNYCGSERLLPNPVSPDEMAAWTGLPKLEFLCLKGTAVEWITQLFTDKYCPVLKSIACEIQDRSMADGGITDAFAPSFVSKIESWAIDDFECYEAMVDTFDCFKPKKVIHASSANDSFDGWDLPDIVDFWESKWTGYMCLDSITDLEIEILSSSVLVESLPPNLKRLKVALLFIRIQDPEGIEQLKEMLEKTNIELEIVHDPAHMVECEDDDEFDFELYFAELDVWKGVKGFKCIEDRWLRDKRKELGL